MRNLFPFRFLPILILVFLILAYDTHSTASPNAMSRSHPARLVTLKIVMSNGIWFLASQHERGAINVEAQNWSLTVSPRCYESGKVIVEITGGFGRDILAQTLEINKQRPTRAVGRGSLADIHIETIQLIDIIPPKNIIAAGLETRCCVTCSGIQVCGCAVEAPCGSCCTGSCC